MFKMIRFAVSFSCIILLANTLSIEKAANSDINGRIFNGKIATLGQYPWNVAVVLYNITENTNGWLCSGSVISEEWIITSAHCLDSMESADVYLGTVYTNQFVAALVSSTELIQHEEYDSSTLANDIGLLKLAMKIGFNELVAPIALSSDPLEGGEAVTVSGFGQRSNDDPGIVRKILYYISVTTITNSECAKVYGDAILEEMVCTSAGSDPFKGTCIGDMGGPAVLNVDTDPLLVGISSFISGTGCEEGNPSGLTRISYYRDWIKEKTGV